MPTYKVTWKQIMHCWATVDAENEKEAVYLAQIGQHNNDTDTDAGEEIAKSYKCEGEI